MISWARSFRLVVHQAGDNSVMENTIGRKIAQRLRALNQTQVWLAAQVDVSNNAVTKWIKSGQISIDKAMKVATTLEITLDELLGGEDGARTRPPENAPGPRLVPDTRLHLTYVDDDELQLLTRLRETPDDLRAMALMNLYRFLASGGNVRK